MLLLTKCKSKVNSRGLRLVIYWLVSSLDLVVQNFPRVG